MRTIKDVFKKVDEMKIDIDTTEMNNTNKVLAETQEHAYNQSLEDIKPIIEKGIKEILEGLKGELLNEGTELKKGLEEYHDTYVIAISEYQQKLRETMEIIIG